MNKTKLSLSILSSCLLLSCGDSRTIEEKTSQIEALLANKNISEATIHAKNLVAEDINNAQARYLLGQAYYQVGRFADAEKEFSKAYDLAPDNEKFIEALVSTLYFTDSVDFANSVFEQADNLSARALYFKYLFATKENDSELINKLLGEGENVSSEPYRSLFVAAKFIKINDFKQAFQALQLAASKHDEIELLQLYASLANQLQQRPLAIDVYKKLAEQYVNYLPISLRLLQLHVEAEDKVAALQLLNPLLRSSPNLGLLHYYKSLIVFEEQKFEEAKTHSERAVQLGLRNQQILLIAALSNFSLQQFEQSYNYFSAFNEFYPMNAELTRLYTYLQFKLGYSMDAVSSVLAQESYTKDDVNLLIQAGVVTATQGLTSQSQQIWSSIEDVEPEQAGLSGALAATLDYVINGNVERLEKNASSVNATESAKAALAAAYYRAGQYEKALTFCQRWLEQEPQNLTPINIAAMSAIQLNQHEYAETLLVNSLKNDGNNPFANKYLAQKAIDEGQWSHAEKLLTSLIEKNPTFTNGYMDYFNGYQKMGKVEQAIEKIEKYYKASDKDPQRAMLYARALFRANRSTEVVKFLERQQSLLGKTSNYYMLLGDSYTVLGELEKAKSVYKNWQALDLDIVYPAIREIMIYDLQEDYPVGLKRIEQAQAKFPASLQLKILESEFYLKSGRLKNAQEVIEGLKPKLGMDSPVLSRIEGQLKLYQGKFTEAKVLLEKAYISLPSSRNLGWLVNVLKRTGEKQLAVDYLVKHIEKQPSDTENLIRLADIYLQEQPGTAQKYLLKVLDVAPNNVIANNNLAWIEFEKNNLKQAEEYALAALKNAEKSPYVLDTLGQIYYKQGKLKLAVDTFDKAKDADPANTDILFRLAQALIANGRQQESKRYLDGFISLQQKVAGTRLQRIEEQTAILQQAYKQKF